MTPGEIALLQAQVDHMHGDPWVGVSIALFGLLAIVWMWGLVDE